MWVTSSLSACQYPSPANCPWLAGKPVTVTVSNALPPGWTLYSRISEVVTMGQRTEVVSTVMPYSSVQSAAR